MKNSKVKSLLIVVATIGIFSSLVFSRSYSLVAGESKDVDKSSSRPSVYYKPTELMVLGNLEDEKILNISVSTTNPYETLCSYELLWTWRNTGYKTIEEPFYIHGVNNNDEEFERAIEKSETAFVPIYRSFIRITDTTLVNTSWKFDLFKEEYKDEKYMGIVDVQNVKCTRGSAFNLDGGEFYAPDEMTWFEWSTSAFNPLQVSFNNKNEAVYSNKCIKGKEVVHTYDVIEANQNYILVDCK